MKCLILVVAHRGACQGLLRIYNRQMHVIAILIVECRLHFQTFLSKWNSNDTHKNAASSMQKTTNSENRTPNSRHFVYCLQIVIDCMSYEHWARRMQLVRRACLNDNNYDPTEKDIFGWRTEIGWELSC